MHLFAFAIAVCSTMYSSMTLLSVRPRIKAPTPAVCILVCVQWWRYRPLFVLYSEVTWCGEHMYMRSCQKFCRGNRGAWFVVSDSTAVHGFIIERVFMAVILKNEFYQVSHLIIFFILSMSPLTNKDIFHHQFFFLHTFFRFLFVRGVQFIIKNFK